MAPNDGLIILVPSGAEDALYWWRVEGATVVAGGQDMDVCGAAGFASDDHFATLALLPVAATTVTWREFPDLLPAQALAVACMEQKSGSIGNAESLHCAAAFDPQVAEPVLGAGDTARPVVTAVIDAAVMAANLAKIAQSGVDPDFVLPVGLVLPAPQDAGFFSASIGDQAVLRGNQAVVPDETAFRTLIEDQAHIVALDQAAIEESLADAWRKPLLNLRTGPFARTRSKGRFSGRQWRVLGALVLGIGLATVAIALVYLLKYNFGAAHYDTTTLEQLKRVDASITDPVQGEATLDQKLAAAGLGGRSASALAAALFEAIEASPSVRLDNVNMTADGTLSATISGTDKAQLAAVVTALQRTGLAVNGQEQGGNGALSVKLGLRAP